MADDREPYGRIVHEIRLAYNTELPHPSGVLPWEQREEGQKEMDMRIGSAVAARALADYEGERRELTLARLSRSVKLARIAALCRARPDRVSAEEVLSIIGDEEAHP